MSFDKALDFIRPWEGGFSNHPRDPGGATMHGVTQRVYDRFRRAAGLAVRSVRQIEAAEEHSIYLDGYWIPAKCPDLPPPLAIADFDGSVNQGVRATAKLLQQAVGAGVDGKVGPLTLAKVRRSWSRNPSGLIVEFCARRAVRYAGTRNRKTFGLGWMRRLCDCERAALELLAEG